MWPVVRGGVHDEFDQPRTATNNLGVDPELIHRVQAIVTDEVRHRQAQRSQPYVEAPRITALEDALSQSRCKVVSFARVVHTVGRPEELPLMRGAMQEVIT